MYCITGASRGIGFALAAEAEARGRGVYGCARRPESASVPPAFDLARVDVREQSAVADWLQGLPIEKDRSWVLAVNHGILGPRTALQSTRPDEFAEVLAINCNGSFNVIYEAMKLVQPPRAIVLLSSSVGRYGRAGWGAYAASKAVIESLAQTLAEELDPSETLVFACNPGGTATYMRSQAYPDEDPSTLPSAQKVASVILDQIESYDPELHGLSINIRDLL